MHIDKIIQITNALYIPTIEILFFDFIVRNCNIFYRSKWVDFSTPYFYSGVSMMIAPKRITNVPLLAFLLPLSPSLWIAIFVSLHVTTVAVALYEWFSPFGLNPSGRQRSKNFG